MIFFFIHRAAWRIPRPQTTVFTVVQSALLVLRVSLPTRRIVALRGVPSLQQCLGGSLDQVTSTCNIK